VPVDTGVGVDEGEPCEGDRAGVRHCLWARSTQLSGIKYAIACSRDVKRSGLGGVVG